MNKLTRFFLSLSIFCVGVTAMGAPAIQQLTFNNYLGNTENIHPKVLYFKDGWKGYKFWMAYTPYPLGETNAENPCIAVSNDGLNWEVPKNIDSVLDTAPDFDGYNSDTHLVYREDTDRLECWYRVVDNPAHFDWFNMRSTDGKTWSTIKKMYPNDEINIFKVCPVIRCENNRYYLYFIRRSQIYLTISGENYNSDEWSEPEIISLNYPEGWVPWHFDMIPSNEEGWYDILLQSYDPAVSTNNSSSLLHCRYNSTTGESTPLETILKPDNLPNSPLGRGIYRASLVYTEKEQFLYYSGVAYSRHRSMFVAHGKNLIEDLKKRNSSVEESLDEDDLQFNGLSVTSEGPSEITVYDCFGRIIGKGMKVNLPSEGLYIFKYGSKTTKKYIR